jgi:hypothetical protein
MTSLKKPIAQCKNSKTHFRESLKISKITRDPNKNGEYNKENNTYLPRSFTSKSFIENNISDILLSNRLARNMIANIPGSVHKR